MNADMAEDLTADAKILRLFANFADKFDQQFCPNEPPLLKMNLTRIAENLEQLAWDVELGAVNNVGWIRCE